MDLKFFTNRIKIEDYQKYAIISSIITFLACHAVFFVGR